MLISFITLILASCQKGEFIKPEDMTRVSLSFKNSASLWENILQTNMHGVFQGSASNYSVNYPFLWIINADTTESYELTRQFSFSSIGLYEITLVVFDENGSPTSASISIDVVDQYIFPTELRLINASQMPDGRYLYNIWVNLDYIPGTHEDYFWFQKNQSGDWIEKKILNIHLDQDSVMWGSFSLPTYNQTHVWAYGTIVNGNPVFANFAGSTHYSEVQKALQSYFYNGSLIPISFDEPAIPGVGNEMVKIEKGQEIAVYFDFKDYSTLQKEPFLEIKNSTGTVRRLMSYVGGTGWAKGLVIEEDLMENLLMFRFGNYFEGDFVQSDYQSSEWFNQESRFLIVKIWDL